MTSKFQMTKSQAWSGMTLKNHIGALFGHKPELISPITTILLQNSGMKNLDTTLSMFPEKTLEAGATDFVWKVIGSDERNIPLVEARYEGEVVTEATTNVGQARTTFELVFAEKWFTKMHLIAGHRPDVYQMRILEDPYEEGQNYVYTCEVWGGQESLAGIPGDEFLPGNRFSIEGAPVEDELSIQGAGIQFTSPFLMRNSVTAIRVEHKVSGAMIDMKVQPVYSTGLETRDPNTGKVHTSQYWMQEVMWQFERQISKLKSRTMMFGKTNRDEAGRYLNIAASGITIKAGSGIREQMEVSNTIFYNRFSLALLEDALSELSEGKLDWDERKFILRTGERGAAQFHRAITQLASGWTGIGFDNTNQNAIKQVQSKFHDNAFSLGFQFTEYRAPNNIHVILEVDPMYDDRVRNKIIHPDGGVAESYRYDILYIGSKSDPNIQRIKVSNTPEIRGYQAGFRNPFTGQRGGIMTTMEDSATMTAFIEGTGALVKDPGRTLSLIPSILY